VRARGQPRSVARAKRTERGEFAKIVGIAI
jgi:hypothetical protein